MTTFQRLATLITLAALLDQAAQAQTSSPPLMETVAEVLKLPPMDAMGKPRPVRLKGVVLGVNASKTAVYFHDDTGGIGVQLTPQVTCPAPGDGIVVEGRAVLYRVSRYSHTRVQASSLTIEGKPPLPKPEKIDINTLNTFSNYDQWVSLKGYVMEWKHVSPTLTLKLVDHSEMTTALMHVENASDIPPNLVGAKLRLTGVNTGDHSVLNAMFVPNLMHLETLAPGYAGVFDAPLASCSDVTSRKVEPGKRYRVHGTVTATSGRSHLYVQGSDGSMTCFLMRRSEDPRPGVVYADAGPQPELKPGDQVDVVGSVVEGTAGRDFGLMWCQVRVTGKGETPKPEPIDIRTLQSLRSTDRWVTLEGIVHAWTLQKGLMQFALSDATGSLIVGVREWPEDSVPKALFGARVRCTGISNVLVRDNKGTSFQVPNATLMEVIRPGATDPFEVPAAAATAVQARRVPPVERLKVKGVLVGRMGNEAYVRDEHTALRVKLALPWQRPDDAQDMVFADGGPLPQLATGDEVEVVGSPIRVVGDDNFEPYDLVNASVRVVGHQPVVQPVEVTLPDIATGAHDSDLVLTRGRLLSVRQMPQAKGEWRSTVVIEASGSEMMVHHVGSAHGAFETLKVDDEILVKAIVNRSTSHESRSLWVAVPGDVKSLGLSPVVRARQIWLWGSIVALVIALLAGWVLLLLRGQRLQAAATRELKAAAEATRASELRWKLLFEQSPLSVQIFSPDGQARRFNDAWRKLFRLSDEAGYAFNVLNDPDLNASGAVNLIRKAFEGEPVNVPPVPFPVNTDPPEYRWIGGVLYPVKNDAGEVMEVVTIHHDITEMKRAEDAMLAINQTLEKRVGERTAELEAARTELAQALTAERELSELKSRFVSMVSHEFRTPLGVTMSAVEIIRHFDEKLTPERRRALCDDIHEATRNMAELMEQVLLLGRVEAGKLSFNPVPMDFETLIRKLVDEQLSATNRKCPVTVDLRPQLEAAQADEALLRHVFGNLISNAVKYSPANTEVIFRAQRERRDIVCEIEDRGIGIPEKDRASLFEAFHRAGNVGDIPGTGLGLVIVKRCVDLHGGSIDLRSEVGKGTTFIVRLPVFSE